MDACSLPPACSWEEWGSLLAGGSPAPLPAAAVAPADAAPPLKRARLSGTCPYRGVSQHKGGERYEAHLWRNGKQVFLGGFPGEHGAELAAAAYDLASIALRGAGATTNYPLSYYDQELAAAAEGRADFHSVVASLRQQAKALGQRTEGAHLRMEAWELELSAVLDGATSLGVFASEAEAARALDWALLARDGLAAAPHLALPLSDYVPQKASSQAFQQEEPAALLTTPILPESHPEQLSVDCLPSSSPIGGTTVGDGVAMPPAPRVVQRRASITPRAGDAASTAPYIFG